MTDTWRRTIQANLPYAGGSALIQSIPIGSTLIRTHFMWGFTGYIASTAGLSNAINNIQVMGLVTTVGNGTESVPNARTASQNAAPPQQRWIYWEARMPLVSAHDGQGGVVTMNDHNPQSPVDSEAMVSAAGVPTGSTLNLWASWSAVGAWDSSGAVNLWFAASAAYK